MGNKCIESKKQPRILTCESLFSPSALIFHHSSLNRPALPIWCRSQALASKHFFPTHFSFLFFFFGNLSHRSRCHFSVPFDTLLYTSWWIRMEDVNAAHHIRAGATLGSLSWQQGQGMGRSSSVEQRAPCPFPAERPCWHTAPPAFNPPTLPGSFRYGPSQSVCSLRLAHAGQPSITTPVDHNRHWRAGNLKQSPTRRFQEYPKRSLSVLTALPEAPCGVHIHASIMLAHYLYITGSKVFF